MNRPSAGGMSGVVPTTSQTGAGAPLEPTWQGYCGSTMDALYLIEWCLRGTGKHVPRRPHDRERADLIASGNIFIYEEHASGIKRWTDGVPWSPSRILGNFLIYRELDKPFEPGQKKKAKPKKENGVTKATSTQRSNSIGHAGVMAMSAASGGSSTSNSFSSQSGSGQGDAETRALVGSLVDSYQFKQDGLIKKTISLSYNNITHHIVSYYTIEDVKSGNLQRPSETFLRGFPPRPELIQSSNFRAPVDDNDIFVLQEEPRFGYDPRAYDPERYVLQGMYPSNVPRSMSVPSVPSVGNLHIGYQSHYIPQQNYPIQQSPTTTMPPSAHGLPPAYSQPPSSSYPYEQSQLPHRYAGQEQNYPMSNGTPSSLRRHTAVFGTNGTSQHSFTAPSLPRSQLSNSAVLPSNGDNSHSLSSSSFGAGHDIYGTQGSATNSSHHLPYDSSSAAPNNTSYNSQNSASSSFDALPHSQNNVSSSSAVASSTDYDGPMPSAHGSAGFHPASGGAAPDELLTPRGGGSDWGNSSFSQYQH